MQTFIPVSYQSALKNGLKVNRAKLTVNSSSVMKPLSKLQSSRVLLPPNTQRLEFKPQQILLSSDQVLGPHQCFLWDVNKLHPRLSLVLLSQLFKLLVAIQLACVKNC